MRLASIAVVVVVAATAMPAAAQVSPDPAPPKLVLELTAELNLIPGQAVRRTGSWPVTVSSVPDGKFARGDLKTLVQVKRPRAVRYTTVGSRTGASYWGEMVDYKLPKRFWNKSLLARAAIPRFEHPHFTVPPVVSTPVRVRAQRVDGVEDAVDSAGPLDIAGAAAMRSSSQLRFDVRMREAWTNDLLASPGRNRVSIEFAKRRAAKPARCVDAVALRPGEIGALLSRTCRPLPPPKVMGTAERTSGRQVRITVARAAVRRKMRFWRATTSYGRFGDPACPAPEYAPPESPRAGSCVDATKWTRIPGRR